MVLTGFMVLGTNNETLYLTCDGTVGELTLSGIKVVRDRDHPNMRVAKWAQGKNTPTVYEVIPE